MANYGLYKSIDTGSLNSTASSIKSKLTSCKGELESYKGTLTDDIWKATAKATLISGYDKLESEVYSELENKLDKVEQVCSLIDQYKAAEQEANNCKSKLANGGLFDNFLNITQNNLNNQEKIMEQCESSINGLCGG